MKKLFTVMLVLTMALSSLAGCSGDAPPASGSIADGGAGGADGLSIGHISMSAVDTASSRASRLSLETAAKAAGIELVSAELAEYDDAAFLTAYESLCAQQVDGVTVTTFSETVLPLVGDLCQQNNARFFMANRRISNEEIHEQMFSNPMCVGNDYCEETQVAYDLVKYLAENHDVKNLAVIGLQKGDVNGDYRDKGIEQACADLGVNLLAETRGIKTTDDVTNAVEGFIASYPEMDGLFIVGGTVTPGALAGTTQALSNHGLEDQVAVAMIDISTGMSEYMDDGPLKIVAGGNLIADSIFSMVALCNDLMGTPLSDEPFIINTKMFYLTSGAEADDYDKYIEGDIPPYTEEEYKELMFQFTNPEVTLESIQKLADEFSVEDVKERHKDLF